MLAAAFALTSILQTAAAPTSDLGKGSYLYQSCRALIRIADSESQAADALRSDYCMGYLDGFIGMANAVDERLCVAGASRGTLARVYVAYMDKDPIWLDKGAQIGMAIALTQSYACQKDLPK